MARSRRGTGHCYRRGNTWWIKYHDSGKALFESSHSAVRDDAEKLLKKRLADIASGAFRGLEPERILISELLEDVIEDYRLRRRVSIDDAESRIRLHLNPFFGQTKAKDFSSSSIKRYVNSRREQGAQDATINRELAVLRRAFSLGFFAEPQKVIRPIKVMRLDENNARTGFLDPDQYRTLRDALPEHIRLIFVVAYHTGIRVGELRQIEWSQVDVKSMEIRLQGTQTKNRHPRTVPIYGEMIEWLKMAKEDRDANFPGCKFVFSYRGTKLGDFRRSWKTATESAGLAGTLFHSTRRSAIRNMERAGIRKHVAMAISGHLTDSIYKRYDIISSQDLSFAREKMNAYLDAVPAEDATTKRPEKARPN